MGTGIEAYWLKFSLPHVKRAHYEKLRKILSANGSPTTTCNKLFVFICIPVASCLLHTMMMSQDVTDIFDHISLHRVQLTMAGIEISTTVGLLHMLTRLTWRVSLVGQELPTLPEHLSSPPVFNGVRVTGSLGLYVCFIDRCLSFFLLVIVLWFIDSDYLPLVSSNSPCIG